MPVAPHWDGTDDVGDCYDSGMPSAVAIIVIVAIVLALLIHPLFALLALLAFLFI